MEASDQSQAGGDPTPEGASPGIAGPAQDSQEQPAEDSNLTTEQPDQPIQPEAERQEQAPDPAQEAQPVQDAPDEAPVQRDQVAEEAQRQSDLEAQRQEHCDRTGGGLPADDGPDSGLGQE